MAKRLLLAAVLAIGLSGCVTAGPGPSPDPAPVPPIVAVIQEKATIACGFLPDNAVVKRLLNFFSPDAAGILELVQNICSAVAGPPQKAFPRRSSTPTVKGVRITGTWVR